MKQGPLATRDPAPETAALIAELRKFVSQPLSKFHNDAPLTAAGKSITVGAVRWGVYAFFDYDGEPIYVGQTRESLGQRIARHLTNQRTDAVAMSVLDPFEVRSVAVWPLPEYQSVKGKASESEKAARAVAHLNSLERAVFDLCIKQSSFRAVLNEKDPPVVAPASVPRSIEGEIVPPNVLTARLHPDARIARRAATIARLAQIIAARDVKGGLRRALVTQANRLHALAQARFEALGGEASVGVRSENEDEGEDQE